MIRLKTRERQEKPPGKMSRFRHQSSVLSFQHPHCPIHDPHLNSSQPQTWALCMPLPKSPACERNWTPGLLTALSLFSESRQLPLTRSFSPALPPPVPEHLPRPAEGHVSLGSLSSLRVSCQSLSPFLETSHAFFYVHS